jgi:large subunit ribosomal protein L27e
VLLAVNFTLQEAKKLFEEKFKSGKNRWFFTKLRF